jgi:stage II sporulation protein P
VLTSDGSLVRAIAKVGDDVSAQVMSVVGSDANGTSYDTWQNNLAFSLRLREELNLKAPNLARPTYLKKSSYNQQLSEVALLIEVGTSGNTQEEALIAAEHVAEALSKIIYENR